MRQLPRLALRAIVPSPWRLPTQVDLLQTFMGRDPWRVSIASMLLCRTRRVQAELALLHLLHRWPTPEYLCRAEALEVEEVVRPCGLHRNRARQLVRFSGLYLGDSWEYLQELPGVGLYVADAVGLFCFGYTDLSSTDHALRAYAEKLDAEGKAAM